MELEYKDCQVRPAPTTTQARRNFAAYAHKEAAPDPFAYTSEQERAALVARLAEARRQLKAQGRL